MEAKVAESKGLKAFFIVPGLQEASLAEAPPLPSVSLRTLCPRRPGWLSSPPSGSLRVPRAPPEACGTSSGGQLSPARLGFLRSHACSVEKQPLGGRSTRPLLAPPTACDGHAVTLGTHFLPWDRANGFSLRLGRGGSFLPSPPTPISLSCLPLLCVCSAGYKWGN